MVVYALSSHFTAGAGPQYIVYVKCSSTNSTNDVYENYVPKLFYYMFVGWLFYMNVLKYNWSRLTNDKLSWKNNNRMVVHESDVTK